MSQDGSTFFGFKSQSLVRWGLILLAAVTGFGSLIDGGALSGSYQQDQVMVYLTALIFLYFVILASLIVLGLEPNKFEMIFIPAILITMIVVAMSFANVIPEIQPPQGSRGTQTGPTTTGDNQLTLTGNNSQTGVVGGNPTSMITEEDSFREFLSNLAGPLSVIFLLLLLGGVLYWLVNRKEFDPDIQIHKVKEYSKSAFDTNNTIIEYYIDASNKVETLKGRAPDWFSPTKFSGHVVESPGPPLSSYFEGLTKIYELARFGEKEMNKLDVEEAKELHHQIINQVNMIFKQLEQEVTQ